MNLVTLHGFLGEPQDFSELIRTLSTMSGQSFVSHSPDYYHLRDLSPRTSWQSWPFYFQDYLESQKWAKGPRVFLGYSQGGRLALNYLRQFHQFGFFDGIVLISAGTGIADSERASRKQQDQLWAHKFMFRDLQAVIEDWNSQPVFTGSKSEPLRDLPKYDIDLLAKNLIDWSVAQDKGTLDFLAELSTPMLYLAGDRDLKYCAYGKQISQNQQWISFETIENSGHRCFLDNPNETAQAIHQFFIYNGYY